MNLAPASVTSAVMNPLGVVVNGLNGNHLDTSSDLLDDFEPQQRDRCNTWPLQKPSGDLGHHASPLMHEDIPEECDDDDDLSSIDSTSGYHNNQAAHSTPVTFFSGAADPSGLGFAPCHGSFQASNTSLSMPISDQSNSKKNTSRRNAWGNFSYADLITQAINSTAEKRMTLSQIYEWFLNEVPFFRDKGDSNSSAGWKNSIRHNLSLHSRFIRVQNEGAGKSSWWMLNPDAKPGKSSRRRTGSMEQQQAVKLLEKKRGRSKKKLDHTRASAGNIQDMYPGSTACSSTSINRLGSPSIDSTGVDFKADFMDGVGPPNAVLSFISPPPMGSRGGGGSAGLMDFRPRADSNVSDYLPAPPHKMNGSQLSPVTLVDSAGLPAGLFDEWDYAVGAGHVRDIETDRGSGLVCRDLIDTLSQSMTLGGGGDPSIVINGAMQQPHHRLLVPPPPYHHGMVGNQGMNNGFNGVGGTGDESVIDPNQSSMGENGQGPRASPDNVPCLLQTRNGSSDSNPSKQQQPVMMNGFGGGGSNGVIHTTTNGVGGPAATIVKTEPPAYQDLFPAVNGQSSSSNATISMLNNIVRNGSTPMLRDALQQRLLTHKQQMKREVMTGSPPNGPSCGLVTTSSERPSSSPDSSTSPVFASILAGVNPAHHTTYLMSSGPPPSGHNGSTPPFLIGPSYNLTNGHPSSASLPPHSVTRSLIMGGTSNGLTFIHHHPSTAYHPYHHHPYGHGHGHHPQQLPHELDAINLQTLYKSEIQCDIDQVIRHELSMNGNLDFTDI